MSRRTLSLEQIFDAHLRVLATTLRPNSVVAYRKVIRRFLGYLHAAFPKVKTLSQLNRDTVRKQFEARFTARRMALDYLAAYRSLMEAAEPRIKLVSSAE